MKPASPVTAAQPGTYCTCTCTYCTCTCTLGCPPQRPPLSCLAPRGYAGARLEGRGEHRGARHPAAAARQLRGRAVRGEGHHEADGGAPPVAAAMPGGRGWLGWLGPTTVPAGQYEPRPVPVRAARPARQWLTCRREHGGTMADVLMGCGCYRGHVSTASLAEVSSV